MFKTLLRHVLPLVVLGSLALSSCVVHEHDRGPGYRGRDHGYYGRDHGYRGHGY